MTMMAVTDDDDRVELLTTKIPFKGLFVNFVYLFILQFDTEHLFTFR